MPEALKRLAGAERSDATGMNRVDNFRIPKGFQTHPSFWCCFNNVVAMQSAIPLGSIGFHNFGTGGVANAQPRANR